MKIIRSKEFTANRPWGALDIANMNGITTRLHWTDQPYKWHINDGEEIFAVWRLTSGGTRWIHQSPTM
jgi:mannose-6-phosphate isomerase-like protein (cupin superfamily)